MEAAGLAPTQHMQSNNIIMSYTYTLLDNYNVYVHALYTCVILISTELQKPDFLAVDSLVSSRRFCGLSWIPNSLVIPSERDFAHNIRRSVAINDMDHDMEDEADAFEPLNPALTLSPNKESSHKAQTHTSADNNGNTVLN